MWSVIKVQPHCLHKNLYERGISYLIKVTQGAVCLANQIYF